MLEVLVDGHDVRVAERPAQPRLSHEPRRRRRIRRVEAGELLQRHVPFESSCWARWTTAIPPRPISRSTR